MNKLMKRIGIGTATVGLATMTIAFGSVAAVAAPRYGGRSHDDHHARAARSGHGRAQGVPLRGHRHRWRSPRHRPPAAPRRTCSNPARWSCSAWTVSMPPPVAST